MKKSSYILIGFLYLFGIYFTSNWFVWNWVFEGRVFGLYFVMLSVIFFTATLLVVKIKSFIKKLIAIIVISCLSYVWFNLSIEIGYWQTKNRLLIIKSKIDKYYLEKGFYPKDLIALKHEGYLIALHKPIFLISKGKYQYTLIDKSFYTLSIEAYGTGDLGFTIDSKNRFSSYDY